MDKKNFLDIRKEKENNFFDILKEKINIELSDKTSSFEENDWSIIKAVDLISSKKSYYFTR